ncbi:CcdC family protein [Paludibaculum fermentans]|uniref:CcdC family protein n=1 Tax=Paludibaculum fermentans TaxID=1473598 RepID=UPI003EB8D8D7
MLNLSVMSIPFPSGARLVGPILGLLAVLAWRVREARGPVSVKKIIFPPLGMATGLSMFLLPVFRIPWLWALGAVLIGALLLAYPLLRTTRLERQGEVIMMRRSNAFFAVLLGLFAIRFAARGYLDTILSGQQTAALAYLLALGMIVRWRTQMYLEYRALVSSPAV